MEGKKIWYFPDGDRPPFGNSELIGHESYIVLNPNTIDANLQLTIYYEDKEPVRNITLKVPAERVKCFQTHNLEYFKEGVIPLTTQYAVKIVSDVPVIIQYGRLDTRQDNLAYYTTMGYAGDI